MKHSPDAIRTSIEASGLSYAEIKFLPAEKLMEHLANYNEENPILIGGGDGTIRSCAAVLMKNKTPFGILPMGTMNLLAHDLDLPISLNEAASAYAKGMETLHIDTGTVNDEHFLCCAGLGIMPEASEYRENLRKNKDITYLPKLTAFILDRMNTEHLNAVEIEVSGQFKKMKTASLVISNNRFSRSDSWGAEHFKKESLQDGELGIYVLKINSFWDKLRLIFKLGFGGWKTDPVITEWASQSLKIRTKKAHELISLDGEPFEIPTPLLFSVKPKSLQLLVPLQQEALA